MDAGKADRHILIVEDDSDLVIVLVQVLEQEGYRVSAASRRVALRRSRCWARATSI
jgi:CheY-like chemotaxis protein